jgi:hypothetical protein
MTAHDRVQTVTQLLARGEAMGMAAAYGKLALGVVLTLIGPLLLTTIIIAIGLKTRWDTPSFGLTFSLACLVLVPLLLWYERRTRGEFLTDAVRGETSPLDASSYGEYELQKAKMAWTAYVETALLGPRLLWHVYDWARGTPAADQPVRMLAAELAVELYDANEGVQVKRLVHAGRSPTDVHLAIRYLASRQWVDTSRARDRVWLTSPTRERLVAALPLQPRRAPSV